MSAFRIKTNDKKYYMQSGGNELILLFYIEIRNFVIWTYIQVWQLEVFLRSDSSIHDVKEDYFALNRAFFWKLIFNQLVKKIFDYYGTLLTSFFLSFSICFFLSFLVLFLLYPTCSFCLECISSLRERVHSSSSVFLTDLQIHQSTH